MRIFFPVQALDLFELRSRERVNRAHVVPFMIEKSMGLSESEIADFCEGLNSMTKKQAEEMANFIENRIDQYVSNYMKKSDES